MTDEINDVTAGDSPLEKAAGKGRVRMLPAIIKYSGSAKAAVVLMALLVAALIVATFYEKQAGAGAVRRYFYGAWWFRGLMGLIALNILSAILHRIPFKARHIGFLVVHVSLLAILAGGLATALWGSEGEILLRDGKMTDRMMIAGDEFYAEDESGSAAVRLPDGEGEKAWAPGHALLELPSGKRFVLVDYFSNCQAVPVFLNDSGVARNPAIEVVTTTEEEGKETGRSEQTLATNNTADPYGSHVVFWDFDLNVGKAESEDEMERMFEGMGAGPGELTILLAGDARIHAFAVEGNIGKDIRVSGAEGFSLRMVESAPDAKMTNLVNEARAPEFPGSASPVARGARPHAPMNPALKIRLTDAQGRSQEETVLAGGVIALRAAEDGMPWDFSYVMLSGDERRRRFLMVQGPDERLHYKYVRSDGSTESGEVEIGKSYPLGFDNLFLKFTEYMPHARMEIHYEAAAPRMSGNRPCMTVRVESGSEERLTVVPYGGKESVAFDGGKAALEFRRRTEKLPFTLELVKSSGIEEAGGGGIIGRESEVICRAGGEEARKTVRANEPLSIAGYKVYQAPPAQFQGEGVSLLKVVRDPGLMIMYIACAALVAGMCITFYCRRCRKEEGACEK
jgi:hypothetical protein